MSNTLTSIMPKILARALLALRKRVIFPQITNLSYSDVASSKGSTIDVPVPTALSAVDVAPAAVPPTATDVVTSTVQVVLNTWKKAAFHLTDKEMGEIDKSQSFLPMQTEEAVKALAQAVNAEIASKYKGIYGYVGLAGTTPFASTVGGATDARKVLNTQLCPKTDRRMVLDFSAGANALALAAFSNLEQTGDREVKIEGELGRKFGFDIYEDDDVPLHTAGVPGGTPLVATNTAAGIASVPLDGGGASGTYLEGDIVTFASHTQTYTVTEDLTLNGSGVGTLKISPALQAAVADGDAVTLKASHRVNLAFHRDAFAVAIRPMSAAMDGLTQSVSITDPVSGLSMRLEVLREYKQTAWELDILWGSKLVRPELACRIAG